MFANNGFINLFGIMLYSTTVNYKFIQLLAVCVSYPYMLMVIVITIVDDAHTGKVILLLAFRSIRCFMQKQQCNQILMHLLLQ